MTTFLLVHGTWAKAAHWPKLQESLTETTRAAGEVPFLEQLPWTGRNRARARQVAASKILKFVQGVKRTSANEEVFMIGHSHGGSAIAYFLKEHPEVAKTLAGCAFLSTPFVAIRPRREAVRLMSALIFFPYIAMFSLWHHYTLAERNGIHPDERVNMPFFTLDKLFWIFIFLIPVMVIWLILSSFFKKASNKVEQAVREQTADIPGGNYLFLRCSGDEAAAALSTAQFIAWVGMKVSTTLGLVTRLIFDPGRSFGYAVFGAVGSLLLVIIAYGLLYVLPGVWKSGFGFLLSPDGRHFAQFDFVNNVAHFVHMIIHIGLIVYAFVAFVVVCLLFLCLVAVFLICLAQAVTSWAFGWTPLSTGFLVDLAIEPLPFGEHRLVHIDWTAGSTELEEKVHSWTYAHPIAIMHLQNWVRASLERSARERLVNLRP